MDAVTFGDLLRWDAERRGEDPEKVFVTELIVSDDLRGQYRIEGICACERQFTPNYQRACEPTDATFQLVELLWNGREWVGHCGKCGRKYIGR